MTNQLGRYIEAERCRRGVSRGELARQLGASTPRQISRLANGIVRLEREGGATQGLCDDIVHVLGLDAAEVRRLAAEDDRERAERFQRWLDEPVRPVIYVRWIPGVVGRVRVPVEYAELPRAVLEAYAADFARQKHKQVCLQVSNRFATWFDENGRVYSRTDAARDHALPPFMTFK